jgi:hypothetical protein
MILDNASLFTSISECKRDLYTKKTSILHLMNCGVINVVQFCYLLLWFRIISSQTDANNKFTLLKCLHCVSITGDFWKELSNKLKTNCCCLTRFAVLKALTFPQSKQKRTAEK